MPKKSVNKRELDDGVILAKIYIERLQKENEELKKQNDIGIKLMDAFTKSTKSYIKELQDENEAYLKKIKELENK
jgi:hypothetical protein